MKKKTLRYFAEPDVDRESKDAVAENATSFHPEETLSSEKQSDDKIEFKEDETHDLSGVTVSEMHKQRKKEHHKRFTKPLRKTDPFPGDAPIDKEKVKKYKRGKSVETDGLRTRYHEHKFKVQEKKHKFAAKQAARSELLQTEEIGFLEAEEGEHTTDFTQHDIARAVDITSATKYFELSLKQFGPYRINYTRNGRNLLIGGKKGHIAAIDWQTKKLMCETNVMESVNDVRWLHIETMFAVAQKRWTYIYDNQGLELHCLKALDSVLRLEFLPYHFLLASSNAKGYLGYLDVSVGQKVAGHSTGMGRLDVMCQNPSNAIIHLGHPGGVVTLWSPNVKEPLVKMLCHGSSVRSLAIDNKGVYMATSGIDRTLKIWDLRQYKLLHSYKLPCGASHLSFSQRGLLAASMGNVVDVYRDCCSKEAASPYMTHRVSGSIQGVQFCPYEDVLGVGHTDGFASLLIPGAGEANFDALESNPFQTKKQRRHAEVQMLLEKIQPDMISLNTEKIGQLDTNSLSDKMEERKKILFLNPQKVEFEPKYKKKGKSKTGKKEQRKRGVKETKKRKMVEELVAERQKIAREQQQNKQRSHTAAYSVLDRFKKSKA